jgi:SPP1 gp7 family putative phage head morphogenesis protein
MNELSASLRYQYEKMACIENDLLGKSLSKSYKNGYYESMYGLQKGIGTSFKFLQLDTRAVNKAVSQKWLGENYSDRIWNNKAKQLPILEREIQRGIARGLSSTQIARSIELRCGVSASNAKRLAVTETSYIREQANNDAYEEAGIESYEFDATLDSRTSEICNSLDRMVFKLKDKIIGVNFPPLHPWCRSTTLPYFEDIVEDGVFRAGRGLDGKTIMLEPAIKYEDWRRAYAPDYKPTKKATKVFVELEKA